jgi:hypothetical protein
VLYGSEAQWEPVLVCGELVRPGSTAYEGEGQFKERKGERERERVGGGDECEGEFGEPRVASGDTDCTGCEGFVARVSNNG